MDERLKKAVEDILKDGEQEMGGISLAACYGCSAGASVGCFVPIVATHVVGLVGDIAKIAASRVQAIGVDIGESAAGAFNKAHIRLHPKTIFRLAEIMKREGGDEEAVKRICEILKTRPAVFEAALETAHQQADKKPELRNIHRSPTPAPEIPSEPPTDEPETPGPGAPCPCTP